MYSVYFGNRSECLVIGNAIRLRESSTTTLPMNLFILPSAFFLIKKSHLHPIGLFPAGRSVISQVEFFSKAQISSNTAPFHFSRVSGSSTYLGIWVSSEVVTKAL